MPDLLSKQEAVARKRLLRELWTIWRVQAIGLLFAGLFLYLYAWDFVPNYPAWDNIHSLCGALSMVGVATAVIAGFWSCTKRTNLSGLPLVIRFYDASLFLGIPVVFVMTFLAPPSGGIAMWAFLAFLCYGFVPSFFICRWLKNS